MKSLADLRKMDISALNTLLDPARQDLAKILISIRAKKEADTSKAWKMKEYIAQILTVKNQIKNK